MNRLIEGVCGVLMLGTVVMGVLGLVMVGGVVILTLLGVMK